LFLWRLKMFQPVNSRVNFAELEEQMLKSWKENKIFEQSVSAREGKPRFSLYEGPPTMNGRPGIHHVIPRVLKDIIPRYKTMKGYYAPRIGGWDTHGLPVELEIEKKLGFSGKEQIELYGVEKFNALCRESVLGYIKEWEKMTERIGYWCDLPNSYVTMKNEFIETVWWAIKQMWDKGLVYQGYRVTPHCPRCETSLSSHEVAQGYKDNVEDPAVFIKFQTTTKSVGGLKLDKPVYFLAWTTTPWTLPGNTGLAVAAEADYAVVEFENEYLILAEARLHDSGLHDAVVMGHAKGAELVGLHYEPLYKVPIMKAESDRDSYRVIAGDFVSMDDGTGIVHIAPAYGEIDFQVGEKEGLALVHNVTLGGIVGYSSPGQTPKVWKTQKDATDFTGEYIKLPGEGKFVKDADKDIISDLRERNLLFKAEKVHHTYPFCWRCDAPLLYYAKQTWYIRTTARKERLVSGNAEINWYPEHIKYGRFGDWLENNVDWAFSRERYWGTPLPVWQCESCGAFDCIGGLDELKKKPGFTGLKEPLDLHRPYIDNVNFTCPKCGGKMQRLPEVIDCWFDSGAMTIAQFHYPFENSTLLKDGRFPADYICEAIDQTRGWFYSLHAISTLLFDQPSYKNVICHGHILDAKGEKMSKSKGNVVDLWSVVNKYGVDALRWYLYTAAPLGNSIRFEEKAIAELSRSVLMTLWNVYSFFVMYANIDNFVPEKNPPEPQSELDRWILSELNQLILDVDSALDKYDPRAGAWPIATFVDNLSNWYVRRSRRRFWKSENDTDKLSAYNTLYQCLVTLAKLMAPFTPFLADELYQNLVKPVSPEAPDSVHLTDFPVADKSKIDEQLAESNRQAMKVSSLGRAARSKAGIKVRQPLQVSYFSTSFERALGNESIKQMVMDELNVKEIKFESQEKLTAMSKEPGYLVDDEAAPTTVIDTRVTPELEAEGIAREIVHRVQGMRRSANFEIADHINVFYKGDDYVRDVMKNPALVEYISQETLSVKAIEGLPENVDYKETFKLSGHEVLLGVKRAA
jgi:isoleucyl-tRNA synthetase